MNWAGFEKYLEKKKRGAKKVKKPQGRKEKKSGITPDSKAGLTATGRIGGGLKSKKMEKEVVAHLKKPRRKKREGRQVAP